jgi:hypothetical protein
MHAHPIPLRTWTKIPPMFRLVLLANGKVGIDEDGRPVTDEDTAKLLVDVAHVEILDEAQS